MTALVDSILFLCGAYLGAFETKTVLVMEWASGRPFGFCRRVIGFGEETRGAII